VHKKRTFSQTPLQFFYPLPIQYDFTKWMMRLPTTFILSLIFYLVFLVLAARQKPGKGDFRQVTDKLTIQVVA